LTDQPSFLPVPFMKSKLLSLATMASLAVPALAQLNAVVPPGYATVPGNSNNAFPWSRGTASMRFQQIYDSSAFTTQGINFPVVIQELKFRPFAGAVTSWSGGTWPNVQIDMATSAVDYLTPSTSFSANLGSDLTTVYNGPVTVVGGATLGAGVVVPTHITITLTSPFIYDPSSGNDFIFDVYLDGTGWSGTNRGADVVSGAGAAGIGGPLGSRIYNTSGLTATTGTIGTNHSLICEFGYVPAAGLYAGFNATPTTGTSPLTVQFNDTSYSSAPGGVLAWAWDFDNDGTIDSNLQNPTWIYTGCGDFSPRLQVFDSAHAPNSIVRTNLIRTDLLQAGFTFGPVVPGVYQFTDTTTPTPTSWAWDFNNDGITDSTVQNPVWAFGMECSATVRLTATLNCRNATSTRTLLLAPTSLATNNGTTGTTSATSVGNFFDIAVLATDGISVCGLTSQTYTGNGAYTVSVYITPDTYFGKDTNISQWRLVATGNGVMNGGTTATPSQNLIALNTPFYLPQGNYGVAIYHTAAAGAAYISYTSVAGGPFANADLSIHANPGAAPGIARTALFAGSAFGPPRQWAGTFHYTKTSLNNQAGYGFFGLGCAGSLGVTNLTHSSRPAIGTTLTVGLNNLPASAAIVLTGFSNSVSAFGALPVNLGTFGAPGCSGRVSPDATLFVLGSGNSANWVFNLPNAPGLIGVMMYQQALVLDPGFNALNMVASDATGLIIGM
jgi:PKD repeat protein